MEKNSPNTPNNYFTQQNEPLYLKCLLAQKNEYSTAKNLQNITSASTIIFAILSILASYLTLDILTALSGLIAVIYLTTNKYLNKYICKKKELAASIQQYIDYNLFLPFFDKATTDIEGIPNKNDLTNSISKIKNQNCFLMKNWYSDYTHLSEEEQIFHCQYESIRWDEKLHKSFKIFLILISSITILLIIMALFFINPSFIKLLCIISWLIPIIDFTITTFNELNNTIEGYQDLNNIAQNIEKLIATKDQVKILEFITIFQNKIYNHRKDAYLIPDFFYKIKKNKYQQTENEIAKITKHI